MEEINGQNSHLRFGGFGQTRGKSRQPFRDRKIRELTQQTKAES